MNSFQNFYTSLVRRMSEMIYKKELEDLKLSLKNSSDCSKIRKIYEYVRKVEASELSKEYKEILIKEAKNEIPMDYLANFVKDGRQNSFDLLFPASVIGGKFAYDVLRSALKSFFEEIKNAVKEGVIEKNG